jgi:nitrate/TMAO reductase-like tetraheme cytochrome c subunit
VLRLALLVSAVCLAASGRAEAQLGTLLSPGVLTKSHAGLEGIANCAKCHEPGQGVTAEKCLSCHKPVADRIARRIGVHRDVKGDCVTCHVEHTGADGELRPFDQAAFDHARVAGFALDGRHAALSGKCAACHKTRSFLTASADCQSCHKDVHNGKLGASCASCHTTRVAFKDVMAGGRFDHAKTAFPLSGAHSSVTCASCHVNGAYRGLSFSSCASCHKDPHQPSFGAVCTTCHTTSAWQTRKVDHSRTAFPLVGRHTAVACASCHKQNALKVKPRSDTCGACHVDVHRGTFKQDCESCHTLNSFAKAPFDHGVTKFPLDGKHAPLACAACHNTPVGPARVGAAKAGAAKAGATRSRDFRGLRATCVSCHDDVHKGQLSASCASCHSTSNFTVTTYKHLRVSEFFAGQHTAVSCGGCHVANEPAPIVAKVARPVVPNVKFAGTATACASCHKDVHLGQVGRECQSCHTVQSAKFGVVGFSHTATVFPLTGKHTKVECAACHKPVTGVFPAGTGTTVRLKGVAVECRSCHQDVHLGQVEHRCESCHSTDSFAVSDYTHRTTQLRDFFIGRHVTAKCASCHLPVTRDFPGGRGRAMAFRIDAQCTVCHRDEHNGTLPNCQRCHRP